MTYKLAIMHQTGKESIIKILEDHVTDVKLLEYGNYTYADVLLLNTKMLYAKYFQKNEFDLFDFDPIIFRSNENRENAAIEAWQKAHSKLITVSSAMLLQLKLPSANRRQDETEYEETKPAPVNIRKVIYALSFLLISSALLWAYKVLGNWSWLNENPKEKAIFLSLQFSLIFISALFLTTSKQGRFIEWLALAVSVGSMIVSAAA